MLDSKQLETLRLHKKQDDVLYGSVDSGSISTFHTSHPFGGDHLETRLAGLTDERSKVNGSTPLPSGNSIPDGYWFAQEEPELVSLVRDFHRFTDGVDHKPVEIVLSAGSSPLVQAILIALKHTGHRTFWYAPPIYHAWYFLAEALGMGAVRLRDTPLWVQGDLDLPREKEQVIVVTDPVWIAGRRVSREDIETLRSWQERTGGWVVVDGTFQYMGWESPLQAEYCTHLLRERTIRIVCPTKALALHSSRFAYALAPDTVAKELRWNCDNITGSASSNDLEVAKKLMRLLLSKDSNRYLMDHIKRRYADLRTDGFLESVLLEPLCGYYTMARVGAAMDQSHTLMNGSYFGLTGYENWVRVNLLSPYLPK